MRLIFLLLLLTPSFAEEHLVPLPEMPALQEELIAPAPEVIIPQVDLPAPDVIPLQKDLLEAKNCASDFHSEFVSLENDRSRLWRLMNEAKKADQALETRRFISPQIPNERLLGGLRGRGGVDPHLFTTHPIGDVLYRSLAELKGFTTQSLFAGLCTGVKDLTGFYTARNTPLFKKGEAYKQAITLYRAAAEKETFGVKRDNIIAATYYLQDASSRFVTLSDDFQALLKRMDTLQAKHCIC